LGAKEKVQPKKVQDGGVQKPLKKKITSGRKNFGKGRLRGLNAKDAATA